MSTNQGYEYFEAEKKYYQAQTDEQRIVALEEMMRNFKKHKGSENMLAELKKRMIKLKDKQERIKKTGGGKKGIKKEGFQVVLLGLPNCGKSALLGALTNAQSPGSPYPFSTIEPVLGTMDYEGVRAQIVDMPSIGHGNFDSGLVNTADCVLVVAEKMEDLVESEKYLGRIYGKTFIVFTKIDLLSDSEKRKFDDRCRSKRLNYVLVSSVDGTGILAVKKKIFDMMGVIRVYTKEPGKPPAVLPVVLPLGSTVKDVAESIRNGFFRTVHETRVTGPSAKFANQKVGLTHGVRDKDVVEFHTR